MSDVPAECNSPKIQDNMSSEADPEPALPRVFDRYVLLKTVARGGMGEVFLATSLGAIDGAERPCVLKVIRKEHEGDSSFLARFLDEARIQAQLEHPGVAKVLEASHDPNGKPFVVLEHVEGRNLSEVRLRAHQLGIRLPWPEAVAIGIAMSDALAYVHERTDANGQPLDIVHRDLSPQNVMVGYGGDVKLIDFGTARGQNRRCQTVSGIVFAKPGYVAPEVANNNPGGVPADLYAVGIMLWELLCGRRFISGDASEHLAAVAAGERTINPVADLVHAPPELDTICQRLTATRIEDRYGSAREASAELVQLFKRAPSMADGQRGVRSRISHTMQRLYPAEPARTRAEFVRLVAGAKRTAVPASAQLPSPSPAPAETPEDTHRLVGTRYRLQSELGRGADGVVHAALHIDLGRPVALKLLDPQRAGSEARMERFRQEARAIAQLEHENIVRVYDFGFALDGRAYLAMEQLEGESLQTRNEASGVMPWQTAFDLCVQACCALEEAHRAGVVHSDIKPGNLFITRSGTLKLLDFGVARLLRESEGSPETTEDGEAFSLTGTPEYVAPEVAAGKDPVPESDVYSLGVVLYECITGQRPFEEDTLVALLQQKRSRRVLHPSQAAPEQDLPRSVDRVLLKALATALQDRYRSASDFRQALQDCLEHASRPQPKARTNRHFALTAACTIAVVAAIPSLREPVLQGIQQVMGGSAVATWTKGAQSSLERWLDRSGRAVMTVASQVKAPNTSPVGSAGAAGAMPHSSPATSSATVTQTVAINQSTMDTAVLGETMAIANPAQPDVSVDALDLQEIPENDASPSFANSAPDDQLERALTFLQEGLYTKALFRLRSLGQKHPEDPRVLAAWVEAAQGTKAWGEARRIAERRARLEPTPESRFALGRLQRATGRHADAMATMEKLIEDHPDFQAAQQWLEQREGRGRIASR